MITATSVNFTAGRTTAITRIVFHCTNKTRQQLQAEACKRKPNGEHVSFHFSVHGSELTNYVPVADTAWGFGVPAQDADAIHIAVYDPLCGVEQDANCSVYPNNSAGLAQLLCDLLHDYGVLLYEIHNNELPVYTTADLSALSSDCPVAPDTPPATACFPVIDTTTDVQTDVVVLDGNCLYRLVTPTSTTICNLKATIPAVPSGSAVTSISVNGVATPITATADYPSVLSLVAYLNTLNIGNFVGSFESGTPAAFSFSLTVIQPSITIDSITVNGTVYSFAATADCVTVTDEEPVKICDLLPVVPTGLTKTHGVLYLTGGSSLTIPAGTYSFSVQTITGVNAANPVNITNVGGTNGAIIHNAFSFSHTHDPQNIGLEATTITAVGTALASVIYTTP